MPSPESSPATHCEHCGAAVRTEGARFCEYCGTKLPERPAPLPVTVVSGAVPDLATRFAALRAHPDREDLLALTPDTKGHGFRMGAQAVGVVIFVVFLFFFLSLAGGAGGPFLLVPLGMLVFGLVMLVRILARAARFSSAPLRRIDALWSGERTKVTGGEHSRTDYYATLEDEQGGRHEYRVDGELVGRCSQGDLGIAYLKDDVLLDFRRLNV